MPDHSSPTVTPETLAGDRAPAGGSDFRDPFARSVSEQAIFARQWLARTTRENTGLVLTLIYLALSAVGFVYEFFFYAPFRVWILDFAQPSDFLLAGVRSPHVVLTTLLVPFFWWLYARAQEGARRRFAWYDRMQARYDDMVGYATLRRYMYPAVVVLYSIVVAQLWAGHDARAIQRGDRGRRVWVELTALARPRTPDELRALADSSRLVVLGTTSQHLFLYDPVTRVTEILPFEAISRVVSRPSRRNRGLGDSAATRPAVSAPASARPPSEAPPVRAPR